MYEVFKETVRVLERGEPCVLATVIRTKGSTPQKPGAKLLVRADGSGVGTLGGGCVEGDIWFAAKLLLKERQGGAQVRDYFLNEELAARDGLVCGGTMYFLLDPAWKPQDFLPYAQAVVGAYEGGAPVAIASVVKPAPGSNLPVGARLFVRENGATQGTLGNPAVDQLAVKRARELMAYGKCDYVSLPNGAEVFVEAYTTPPTLVLIGGGHISKALAPMAKTVGFRVYVVDDRPEFANRDRFPMAEAAIVAPSYDRALEQVPVSTNTFIVVATRGHRYDDLATEAAVRSRAGYVGLVGSIRKSLLIFRELFRKDIPEERIRAIHAPVGLSIGGRTPEEIAVSILSEILMVRLGGDGRPMKMEDRLFNKAKEHVRELEAVAEA